MSSRIPLAVALLSFALLARADDEDEVAPAAATPSASTVKKSGTLEATSPPQTVNVFKNTGSSSMKVEISLQVGSAAIEVGAALPSGNVLCTARPDTSRFATCVGELPPGNTLQFACDLYQEKSEDEWKTCTWEVTYSL